MNAYILNTKTNKIRKSGEVAGKGGLVVCHTIRKGKLYSLWDSGTITVLGLKSGKARAVNMGGWNDVYPFLWTCERAIPKLGASLQREIANYISFYN